MGFKKKKNGWTLSLCFPRQDSNDRGGSKNVTQCFPVVKRILISSGQFTGKIMLEVEGEGEGEGEGEAFFVQNLCCLAHMGGEGSIDAANSVGSFCGLILYWR
ncbi:hypothetical protein AMTRI_Chr03g146730 [Amborella trichopoda]